MRDKFNLNTLPHGMSDEDFDETLGEGVPLIPGMGMGETPAPEPEAKGEQTAKYFYKMTENSLPT